MPHMRTQIREAAKTLFTGLASTGSRVECGRTRPLPPGHGTSLLIYTREESSLVASSGEPPHLDRELELIVEGRVSSREPPDDDLDQVALEVEERAGPNQRFGGLVREFTLVQTTTETIANGDRHEGMLRMRFRVLYSTAEGSPDTAV